MSKFTHAIFAAALLSAGITAAQAAVNITEVAPWGSGKSEVAVDWFELTNSGLSALDISGWKMDDNSAQFSKAVALSGVSSMAAGQSVVFVEGTAADATAFASLWFGTSVPAGLSVGYYSGSGVGLSQSSDTVNVYNASGALQASVSFGASGASAPYQTFDNAARLNNTTLSQLSVTGINGAFAAAGNASEIGSPGSVAAVPEPETYAMLLAGLVVMGAVVRRRQA